MDRRARFFQLLIGTSRFLATDPNTTAVVPFSDQQHTEIGTTGQQQPSDRVNKNTSARETPSPPHTAQQKQDESRREAALMRLLLTGRPQCVQCMLLAIKRAGWPENSELCREPADLESRSSFGCPRMAGSRDENDLLAYAQPTRLALLGRMVKRKEKKERKEKQGGTKRVKCYRFTCSSNPSRKKASRVADVR